MKSSQLEEYYFGFPVNRQNHLRNQKMFRTELSQEKLSSRSRTKNNRKLQSLQVKYSRSSNKLRQKIKTMSKTKKDPLDRNRQKPRVRANLNFISHNKVHIQYILQRQIFNKNSAAIVAQRKARLAYLKGNTQDTIQLPQQSKEISQDYYQISKYTNKNTKNVRKPNNFVQNPQKLQQIASVGKNNQKNIAAKIIKQKTKDKGKKQYSEQLKGSQNSQQQILPLTLKQNKNEQNQLIQETKKSIKQDSVIYLNNIEPNKEKQTISLKKNSRDRSFDDQVLTSFKQNLEENATDKIKQSQKKLQQSNPFEITVSKANRQTNEANKGFQATPSQKQNSIQKQQMKNGTGYVSDNSKQTKQKQQTSTYINKLHVQNQTNIKNQGQAQAKMIESDVKQNQLANSQTKRKYKAFKINKMKSQYKSKGQLSINSVQYSYSNVASRISLARSQKSNKQQIIQKLKYPGVKLRPTELVASYVKRSGGSSMASFKIPHLQLLSKFSLSDSIKQWSEFQQHRKIAWRDSFDPDSNLEELISYIELHLILVNQIAQFVVMSDQIYVQDEASWRYLLNFLTYKAFYYERMRISKCLNGQLKQNGKKISCFTLVGCEVSIEDIQRYIDSAEIVQMRKDIEDTNKAIWKSLQSFYKHLKDMKISNPLFNLQKFNQKDLKALLKDINDQLQTLLTKFEELNKKQDEQVKEVIAYRVFKIIEITLLISQFQGYFVKQYEEDIQIGYFDQYINKNYPIFKEVFLRFN